MSSKKVKFNLSLLPKILTPRTITQFYTVNISLDLSKQELEYKEDRLTPSTKSFEEIIEECQST